MELRPLPRGRDCPPTQSQRSCHGAGSLAVALVGLDCANLLQGERDVVEAVQQPVLDVWIDVEARRLKTVPTHPADLLRREVDLALPGLCDRLAVRLGGLDRQQPDLRAVRAE